MASIAQIRAGFAANLNTIPGVQVEPTGAYQLGNPTPPTIWVFPDETRYHQAMGNGLENRDWVVQAFVGYTTDIGAQTKLDTLLASTGTLSVKAALEADKTLGGVVDDLIVRTNSGYRVFSLPAMPNGLVLGADWNIELYD